MESESNVPKTADPTEVAEESARKSDLASPTLVRGVFFTSMGQCPDARFSPPQHLVSPV
jgi:hypothetical protein